MTVLERALYRPVSISGPFAGRTLAREARIADWKLSTKKIDLVCIKNRHVHAIELKVCDWKGALRQAYANLYVADYSHVALWHEAVRRVNQDAFKKSGIGLLRVTKNKCNVIIDAKRSNLAILERKDYIKKRLGGD